VGCPGQPAWPAAAALAGWLAADKRQRIELHTLRQLPVQTSCVSGISVLLHGSREESAGFCCERLALMQWLRRQYRATVVIGGLANGPSDCCLPWSMCEQVANMDLASLPSFGWRKANSQSTDPARCRQSPALAATAIRWGCRGWHAIWYTLGTFFCPLGNRDSNEMSCSTLPLLGYLCKRPHCLFLTVATDGLRCTDLPLPSQIIYTAMNTC